MKWSPMGEGAVLVWCADEAAAGTLAAAARAQGWPWLIDVVQAYASVAVYFERQAVAPLPPVLRGERGWGEGGRNRENRDPCEATSPPSPRPSPPGVPGGEGAECYSCVMRSLESLADSSMPQLPVRRHAIPVCYERNLDLDRIATHTGLDRDSIIRSHLSRKYTVYAIGFCPGFPYLGYLADELANVPRLPTPRLRVPAGSVGLTGRQTGIYTEARPGGWNIVGQTPLELVNVADDYFPLRTGDEVEFVRVDEKEFQTLSGERLATDSI